MAPVQERSRCFNFSAGPAMLPDLVLDKIVGELGDYDGLGMSILEMGHRDAGGPVQEVLQEATDCVRHILGVPSNYAVIWQQGGAHGQFAAVPLNLLRDKTQADYVDTGVWSRRAMNEARKFCTVRVCAELREEGGRLEVPPVSEWNLSDESAYVHICGNDTISGVEFLEDLDLGDRLLVADFTSTLLSRPVNISRYAALYCSAGKNLGPAGVCLVVVRRDLLDFALPQTPMVLHWKAAAETSPIPSLANTPPVFSIFACGHVLKGLRRSFGDVGTLDNVKRRTQRRASAVYKIIDESNGFYINKVASAVRSQTTICFTFGRDATVQRQWTGSITDTVKPTDLEEGFMREAKQRRMNGLAGHPAFGGIRICLYNGLPDEAVDEVLRLLRDFAVAESGGLEKICNCKVITCLDTCSRSIKAIKEEHPTASPTRSCLEHNLRPMPVL
ncbi:unnamed protein product [Durusdinium trenchii]|uniref:phosphoserine transaminase n=1 Tax=Durusdinium trenchii TaxID=1381693 RepID=A0ABP0RM79_9DINO